jgi:glycopeptide antibiotics resistance protein
LPQYPSQQSLDQAVPAAIPLLARWLLTCEPSSGFHILGNSLAAIPFSAIARFGSSCRNTLLDWIPHPRQFLAAIPFSTIAEFGTSCRNTFIDSPAANLRTLLWSSGFHILGNSIAAVPFSTIARSGRSCCNTFIDSEQ